MTTTVAKTYRFPVALHKLIETEAEKTKTNEAEVVRLALRHYFASRQDDTRLENLEIRLVAKMDSQTQHLVALIQKVISMAQPE